MARDKKLRSGARSLAPRQARKQREPEGKKTGASKSDTATGLPQSAFRSWIHSHIRTFFSSLGRLYESPFSTLLTAAVLGIALALPSFLYLAVDNAQSMADRWRNTSEFAVYLKPDIDDLRASQIAADIRLRDDVSGLRLITRSQAAEEFRRHSAFGAALDMLDSNPLPAVLIVTPRSLDPREAQRTIRAIKGYPQVDQVKLDREWLERLQSIIQVVERSLNVVILLLGFAVVIVVGNTIRLDIQNRRQEIIVSKLVGGTDAFVRRPFLYSGIWYGFAGGVCSILLVTITLLLIEGPLNRMVSQFGGEALWLGHSFGSMLLVLMVGAVCGWMGSWLAVGRQIKDIEPS